MGHPEMVIAQIAGSPAIDGALTDPVWGHPDVATFDIRWDDDALRQTYPAVGPYRAGQYQPEVNGGLAPILDPADATVKIFHNDDILYLGFDVRDGVVQFHPAVDRWDGVRTTITHWPDDGIDPERYFAMQGRFRPLVRDPERLEEAEEQIAGRWAALVERHRRTHGSDRRADTIPIAPV